MTASSPSALSAPTGVVRLPRTVETITLAHDGDDPDAKPAAAQAYHRGVVRYLGQGLMLKMTAPPTGCDPNDVLKRGGPDALKKLLTEARCDLGKFDNAAFLDEVCKLDDLAYDRARATALKLLGLSKLDTLDKERKATRKRWAETPGSTEIPPVPDDDQPWPEPVTDIGPVLDAALRNSRATSSPRRTGWRRRCSGAPMCTCCRARISASTSRRGSAFGARSEAPANQPCSNVSRTSRPTRSSPARSRPRRLFRIIDRDARDPAHRRGRQHRQQEQQPRPARHPQQRPPAADGLRHPVCPDA